MERLPAYTQFPWQENYSEIIDVRSENEFEEDHIPGAINLPVLNNQERNQVGTIYKQVSSFEARKIGASLVAKNISQHLSQHFANKSKNYYPLIYCWRGYKTYRSYVREQLEILPCQFTYKILSGLTGSGKTYILHQLAEHGVQILDLEKLAKHRGSLLGQEWQERPEMQPSQKEFESFLLQNLQHFDRNKVIWVESESNKIGGVYLPLKLWQKMKQSNCLEIQLPLAERVKYLLQEYSHLVANPDVLKDKLQQLKFRHGCEKVNQWYSLIDRGEWQILIADLLKIHYDPTYLRSLPKIYQNTGKVLAIPDLSSSSVEAVLDWLGHC